MGDKSKKDKDKGAKQSAVKQQQKAKEHERPGRVEKKPFRQSPSTQLRTVESGGLPYR